MVDWDSVTASLGSKPSTRTKSGTNMPPPPRPPPAANMAPAATRTLVSVSLTPGIPKGQQCNTVVKDAFHLSTRWRHLGS
eukprot:scaffold1473_cov375-Prasinococcus_capsulatus_cf.AAC.8